MKNLAAVDNRVDVVLSHCAPSSIQDILSGGFYQKDALTDYLDQILELCRFRHWFFGHYHENRDVGAQFTLLYEMIVPLTDYLPMEDQTE